MNIQFCDLKKQYLNYQNEIDAAVKSVLQHGQFIMGPEVAQLEAELACYTGADFAVTCGSGTDALQIALMAIGVGPGDEVITTPFTFAATAEAICLLGAKPIYVDIESDSYLIDATQIEAKLTSRTKAIIPVSLYGQIADMDIINEIASKASDVYGHKIYVIEDAAQSFGAMYRGKKSCNVSDIACTSFFPTKPLGCYGDGGALFTSDKDLAEVMRQIRVHGQSRRYQHTRIGLNSRLDTIQAAILLVKLKHFDEELPLRREWANFYDEYFADSAYVAPMVLQDRTHVYGQYTLRVQDRDVFVSEMSERDIPTCIHYPIPLHKQNAFKDQCVLLNAELAAQQVVSLPMPVFSSIDEFKLVPQLQML